MSASPAGRPLSLHSQLPSRDIGFFRKLGADPIACLVRYLPTQNRSALLRRLAVDMEGLMYGATCRQAVRKVRRAQEAPGFIDGHRHACSSHDTGALLLSIANAGSALSIARGTGSLSSTKLRTAAAGRPRACSNTLGSEEPRN